MLKPKATQARVVKVPQPSPHAGEEEEEEFELQGQMLIVGNMFKKKLIEVLTALQAGKKKVEWFSRTAERIKKRALERQI